MDRYKEFGDVDLLSKLKAGDELAFESLYQLYSPQLYKKLLKHLKQVNIAEELLQDVFVKVLCPGMVASIAAPWHFWLQWKCQRQCSTKTDHFLSYASF